MSQVLEKSLVCFCIANGLMSFPVLYPASGLFIIYFLVLNCFSRFQCNMSFRRGRGGQGNGGSRFSGGGGRDGDNAGGRGSGAVRREAGPTGRLSNHTSDASMASARIFIGNLPTNDPRLTKEFLEERFSRYGQILGKPIAKTYFANY
jgi:hypothetical protein